ncbi:MAG: outer membrane beta-barrel protein [Flavobacteriales bacterium]
MRRFFTFCFLLFSLSAFAQNEAELGLITRINATDLGSRTGLNGYQFGFFYRKMITDKLAFDTGLSLRKQRQQAKIFAPINDVDVHYMTAPLAGRYFFKKNLYARLGLNFDMLVKARTSTETVGGFQKAEDYYHYFHLGAAMGFGYVIKNKVDVHVEYTYGLNKTFVEPSIASHNETNVYISLGLGWILYSE